MKRAVGGAVLSVLLLSVFIFIGRLSEYILAEYVYNSHTYQGRCKPGDKTGAIPKHIHQIYFLETVSVLPEKLVKARRTWIEKNPGFKYTLWNESMINALVESKFPGIRQLYRSYDHWVKRVDVARYLVIYYYGGWYVDMDMTCIHGIEDLTNAAHQQNKSLVFRWTSPTGCSNDFIGVTPNHSFFTHVIAGLPESKRWYIFPYASTMFSTGPFFLWGRFLNYPCKEEMLMLYNHSAYLSIMHGSSWHSWDGKLIWYFYNHVTEFWTLLFIAIFLSCALFTLYRCRGTKCTSIVADMSPKMSQKSKRLQLPC